MLEQLEVEKLNGSSFQAAVQALANQTASLIVRLIVTIPNIRPTHCGASTRHIHIYPAQQLKKSYFSMADTCF